MSEILVLYRSKYGSTEKYATWIAEDTGADVYDARRFRPEDLDRYRTVVYCGGLYAGGILGFSRLKKALFERTDLNRILVAVGATSEAATALPEVRDRNLPPEQREAFRFFLLRGALNYPGMRFMDRLLMSLLVRSLRRKDPETLDDDAKGLLATYGKTVDFTRREAVAPVVAAATEKPSASAEA